MYGSAEAEERGPLEDQDRGLGHPWGQVEVEIGTTAEALRKGHCSNAQGSGPGPEQLRAWERFKTTRTLAEALR